MHNCICIWMHSNDQHTLLYFMTRKDVKPASTKPKAFQLWPLPLSTSGRLEQRPWKQGPLISSLPQAAEGHKTAGNGSLSAALDASLSGMPRADKQLSRPARSIWNLKCEAVKFKRARPLLEELSRWSPPLARGARRSDANVAVIAWTLTLHP